VQRYRRLREYVPSNRQWYFLSSLRPNVSNGIIEGFLHNPEAIIPVFGRYVYTLRFLEKSILRFTVKEDEPTRERFQPNIALEKDMKSQA
jgi:hypothetical protein